MFPPRTKIAFSFLVAPPCGDIYMIILSTYEEKINSIVFCCKTYCFFVVGVFDLASLCKPS